MKDTYVDEMEICSEFEEGIEKQEFQVFYQPVVDAKTGKIVSAEALVRWFHEQKGFISPGQFIPVLEKGGYISELDHAVTAKQKKILKAFGMNEGNITYRAGEISNTLKKSNIQKERQ